MLLEIGRSLLGSQHTFLALEGEGRGHNADGQRAHLASNLCHYRAGSCAGATAHARSDKDHIGAFERFINLFGILFCSLAADAGIASPTDAYSSLIHAS